MTKNCRQTKDLLCLCFHLIIYHHGKSRQELKQGRDLETEADVEGMECSLLAYSP